MQQQEVWLLLLELVLLVFVTCANCHLTYDFIVVGSGAGGAAVARRLSESGEFSVLLIESGGHPGPFYEVPSNAPTRVPFSNITFRYQSIPQRDAGLRTNRIVSVVAGRMLGGGTALHYMVFNRGSPYDWDNWAKVTGDASWNYNNMLKYFKRSETYRGDFPSKVHHGDRGPITVSRPHYAPGLEYWLAAGLELGYPIVDPNGPQQRSFTPIEFSKRNGLRVSSFDGYLNGKLKTANLKLLINTNVTRVLFHGKRAVGVSYITKSSNWEPPIENVAFANKEIIISAGNYNSPLILQRSGIGPASVLYAAKIPIVKELPTGLNQQQHPAININFVIRNVSRYIVMDENTDLTPENWHLYRLYGDGPFSATTGTIGQAFLSSSVAISEGNIDWPDVQIHVAHSTRPFLETDNLYMAAAENNVGYGEVAMSASVWLGRPKSRGSISINPHDILGHPILDMGFLTDYRDMQSFLDGIRKTLHIFERTKAYQNLGARYSPIPLPACDQYPLKTEEYWICYVRQTLQGGCHPAGTNKMGRADDPTAVVDSQLRVIGVEGLRVADASIMPFITNANPQAAIYAIGEKAADMILKKWKPKLPSQELSLYSSTNSLGYTHPSSSSQYKSSFPDLLQQLIGRIYNYL